ncbi:ABC transporter substrate-binding protein [Pelagibacterium sp. 26DY04]|uniref:ABC transporter substrate-binding protein n=1 Tax=Pelagibacterium sp. 26DY04 TaxID=2967130 RepID=UPI002814E1F5|nr:ABC transporter substrate-binding protein [Pelagibacterium sp. 26DY04]WMT86792.1 ABC transporter substrate-binding protein [Pelagibacterium sp. 26DY04]
MNKALLLGALAAFAALPAQAQVLTVCLEGSPEIFNPELSSNGTTIYALGQIYDGLVSVERGGSNIEPALAESWEVSEDGLTYTFTLRQDVAWQSNALFTPTRPMNADDVIFTFERMMNPEHPYYEVSGGNYVTFNAKLADILESVEKVDDYTVSFTLKEPLAAFIGTMAHGSLAITSAEYADAMMAAGTPEQLDLQPIGTGPFQLQAYQADAIVRLLPFAETWGAQIGDDNRTPMVDAVVMAISSDATVRLQRALAGECLIGLYPNLADRETIEQSGNLEAVRTPVASTGMLHFNFEDEKFQDQRVRQALAQAIDMENLVEVVYSGMGHVTGAVVPPALWGHAEDIAPWDYDPEAARALLEEAGFADGFTTQLWAVPVARPYMPNGRRAAEIIQADWAEIGVQAEIVTYEWAEYIERARNGEAEVGMFGGIYDFPDPSQIPNNYLSCDEEGVPAPSNIGRWCDDDFNTVMTEAGSITDQDERTGLYLEAQQIVHDQVPVVVLGGADQITAVNTSVKGYVPAIFGTSRLSGVTVE